jgi:uncharacterized repeat protein (TIGR01451 family)
MSPDAPRRAAAFRQVVEEVNDDLEAVVEAHKRLQNANAATLLTDLKAAVREGRDDDATTLLETLGKRYRDDTAETKAAATASAARFATDLDTATDFAQVITTISETQLLRSQVLTETAALLEDAETAPDRSAIATRIERASEKEEALDRALDRVETLTGSLSLPANLVLTGVETPDGSVAVGESTVLTISLANVGDTTATNVSVDIDLPSGLTADTTTFDLGAVENERTVSQSVSADAVSVYSVDVIVTSDNASETRETATLVTTEAADSEGDDSGLDRFDTNGNGRIDAPEVLDALVAYSTDETIGGETVTFGDIRSVIVAYETG